MNKLLVIIGASICMLGIACSRGAGKKQKRVVVMASGKLTVADKTITIDPSRSHNEQELLFPDDKLTLTVKSTDGTNKTFDLTDNAVYVLNLQNDTLTGGLVNYGATGRAGSISAAERDRIIDSTQQLLLGKNVSDEKGTYFLPPFSIKKVSAKMNTKIIGSFKGIPYSNAPDESGAVPDVIKFSTNKDKRETLKELDSQKIKI